MSEKVANTYAIMRLSPAADGKLGMKQLRLSLRADDVIEDACRYAGMDDFGDIRFREGLEVLLRACEEEAALSLFGYFGTRWDIRRFLSNLLRFRHEEKRAPQILQARIQQPIIITGLPRSGTTFLHTLLAADPANVAPRVWQLIHPYPNGANRGDRDTRRRSVDRQLRMFEFSPPAFVTCTRSGQSRRRNARKSTRMSSPVCALTQPIPCRAIAAGSMM